MRKIKNCLKKAFMWYFKQYASLYEKGYRGPLTIEREISGEQQLHDILAAKAMLEKLL